MDELIEILQDIKVRPEIYLGKKSLELLKAFITGFMICQNKLIHSSPDAIFLGFQKYVEQKYGLETTHGWHSIIRFFTSSDEEAFDEFFLLFDNYTKSYIKNPDDVAHGFAGGHD